MTRHILPLLLTAGIFLAGVALAQTSAANPKVLLKTTKGDITIELYPDKAPVTVKNILDYVNDKFYDGLIFHRVMPGFMIQCGGMTAEMSQKSGNPPIKNEAGNGLKNTRGTLAMARTNVVDSASSQFFINLKDNTFLNHKDNTPEGFGYCVFGKVVAGMDVVDAIAKVPTTSKRGHGDVPVEPITILSATVVNGK
ncbi:MAG TPA: peptidylprolyl isomerase [Candidatus Latescibacteria bacterium]|nr:peptidylprolyl isomerase [Candidatus Latescibacterota bacterium]